MNADIRIRYNDKDYDFYLSRDENGVKKWRIWDSRRQPPMFSSDRPLFSHVPPEEEQLIEQDYFYAGMGEEDFEHGKRYYNAPGCDARRKGAVVLGPKIVQSTITLTESSALSITNNTFETGDTTGWTDLDAVTDVNPYAGTYHARITLAQDGTEYFYQNLSWENAYRGKIVRLTGYVCAGSSNVTIKIGINDGQTTTYSSTTTSTSYTLLSVTKQLASNAGRIQIRCWANEGNVGADAADFDNLDITPSGGHLKGEAIAFKEYASSLYAADGNFLIKWDGTDWDEVTAFWADITDLAVWGDYLFIALDDNRKYWYYDGTDFTESTISDGKAKFFGLVGTTLWESVSDYQVKSSTNPLNGGSWSAATTVGNSNKVITDIIDHPDRVLVAQEDGFWEVGASSNTDWIPDLHHEDDTDTGKNFCLWKGNVYVPSGLGSIYELDIDDNVISTITPSSSAPGQDDFVGRTMALFGDAEYLYAVLDNGTDAEVLCGRWETIDNETDFWWHHVQAQTLTDASDNVHAMIIASLPSVKRLWLGCASTTDGIYYLHHPAFYGDVTQDSNYKFDTSGNIKTSWLESDYPHILKTFYSLTVRTEDCTATEYITVSYRLKGVAGWTTLGVINDEPEETLYFDSDITSKAIQLRFAFTSSGDTVTPQLKGYTLRCIARPFDLEAGRISLNEHGEFRTFGGFETAWKHSEYRDTPKNFYAITIISQNLSTTNYITFEYKLDDDASYTTHDVLIDTSPTQTLYFPADTVGKILWVKFTPATTTGDLIAYIIDGMLRPRKRKEMEFALELSPKHVTRTGGIKHESVSKLAGVLRDIDDTQWPVKLTTFDDQEYDITFQNMTEQMKQETTHKDTEYIFTIRALGALLS